MLIRIPDFIGKKLYFIGKKLYYKTKRCILNTWCKQTYKGRRLSTKYYLSIGGRKKMKRYCVYIEIPDDHVHIKYGYRRFKITAWLLARKAKKIWNDISTIIYDRKKGVITYEK